MRLGAALLAAAAVLAGCGQSGFGHDVKGFTQTAATPADQAVLRSIATYRTTADERQACSLITAHFLRVRFDGKQSLCQAVARNAPKHELPKKAVVQGVSGDSAAVRIDEPTATRSLYRMRREGGTWKIDDIVEAP
jgi:predicted small secreted protein